MKKAFGIILIALGIVVFLFLDSSLDTTLWTVLWSLPVAIGVAFAVSSVVRNCNTRKQANAKLELFKAGADKVLVKFDDCEIKSLNYVKQEDGTRYRRFAVLDVMDTYSGDIEKVEVVQSIVEYETERFGEKITYYSPMIYKDRVTLGFLLLRQKETYLYVDRDNRFRYYFDFEFLTK